MLKARGTTRVITPRQLPIQLGGYAKGTIASRVESPLEVNCLVLTDGIETAILVSLDLLYVTHALRESVLRGLEDLGITDRNLFMAASHTHYAPAIDETKPDLGQPNVEYRSEAAETITEAIRDALLGPHSPVSVASASRAATIGINRRRKRLLRAVRGRIEVNQVGMYPNPGGPTDPIASVVAVRSHDRTLAYVWSAACHPTGLADGGVVSAHWPGVVRARLRDLEATESPGNKDLPVLFLQGFSGDVRPPSGRVKTGLASGLLRRIRLGRTFEPLDSMEYSLWSHSAADQVATIALRCSTHTGDLELHCARSEFPASRFARGGEGLPPVSFHRVSIGDIVLVGLSAEPVSGYAHKVRSLAPEEHVIPVGCLDNVIGYWPTQEMFREGGYEVARHCRSFGIAACEPHIESRVLEELTRLLADAGGSARRDRRGRLG